MFLWDDNVIQVVKSINYGEILLHGENITLHSIKRQPEKKTRRIPDFGLFCRNSKKKPGDIFFIKKYCIVLKINLRLSFFFSNHPKGSYVLLKKGTSLGTLG